MLSFYKFRTENELRKISNRVSASVSVGFLMPSLQTILNEFPTANSFYALARENQLKARSCALAVFAGVLLDSKRDYEAERDSELTDNVERSIDSFLDMMIDKEWWYGSEDISLITSWMTEAGRQW